MKTLVTSGCSFSRPGILEKDFTWSNHLESSLPGYNAIHIGLSAQGNDLISRKTIYTITQLIKEVDPSDLLVGIMWSGSLRHAVYLSNDDIRVPKLFSSQENPTAVVPNNNHWHILIPDKTPLMFGTDYDVHSRNYYEYFYDPIGSSIETCEHILRTQWFLEKNNIKYFMSTYMSTVLNTDLKNNPEISHLYDEINFDNFLPVIGEYEWCMDYSGLSFPENDKHPSAMQHKKFTEQIIIPFLKEKQYI